MGLSRNWRETPLGRCPLPVPQTDPGRLVEETKVDERTLAKELGKLTPYLRKKGCCERVKPLAGGARGSRRVQAQATGYHNHRSLLKP